MATAKLDVQQLLDVYFMTTLDSFSITINLEINSGFTFVMCQLIEDFKESLVNITIISITKISFWHVNVSFPNVLFCEQF